nr:hypothetical protein [Tanacetum cinerariifolium]
MKLNWDGPPMPLLETMLVVPIGGDGVDAAAANEVSSPPPPPHVPPTHTSSSTPGPSLAAQDTLLREPTPSPVREPTPFREPTPNSPRPPSPPPYPRSEEVGPTNSTRLPSPTRQTSFQEDVSEGGGDYVSSLKSDEVPPTTAATAAGGAEDSAALTALSLKLDRRTRTTRRRLMKTVTSFAFEHFLENISADEDTIPANAQSILAGSTPIPSSGGVSASSSMDPADQAAAAAPSSTIPAADKGKAPMVDDSLPADQFARQQEELAQKAQAESVASLTKQGTGLSAQRRRELDAAQLIYTEADWLELMAKIATNTALSKQLLGDDVNEDNMNERLAGFYEGVKALSIAQLKHEFEYIQRTLEQSNSINFKRTTFRPTPTLEAPSAKRARQEVPQDVHAASSQVPASVPAALSTAPAVSVPAAPSIHADVSVPAAPTIAADVSVSTAPSVPADTEVHADESRLDATQTASKHVSTEHTVDESTPSSLRTRRKQIAKKRVTPIVNVADDALIKFDSASDSDDDPFPYAPFAGWEMVPSLLGFIHDYYDMEGHTKHFTSLRELLHMVEKNDPRRLLGAVDILYHREEPDTFALILWGDLCVHVLETVDGWVIYMFVDVSYPLSAATLKCMLKHGLEVPKLLVGGDLTMAEQLVSFIKAALINAQSVMVITFHVPFWNDKWLVQGGMDLELASPEQTATGKDVSNPFMDVMVCQKPLGYFSSPLIHVLRVGLVINPPGYVVPAGRLRSHSCCWVSAGKHSFCCQ